MPTVTLKASGGSLPNANGGIRLPDQLITFVGELGELGGQSSVTTIAGSGNTTITVPTNAKYIVILIPSDATELTIGTANGLSMIGAANEFEAPTVMMAPVEGGTTFQINNGTAAAVSATVIFF